MLFKKELAAYLALPYPKVKTEAGHYYVANAAVVDLQRSGRVLIADFFQKQGKTRIMRFCSDGHTWQTAEFNGDVPVWSQKNPYMSMSKYIPAPEEAEDAVRKFLKGYDSYFCGGILRPIAGFVEHAHYEQTCRSWKNQESLREKHFSMYPELPGDLPQYCDRNVFDHGYLFLSKIRKDGRRGARCSECRASFTVKGKTKLGEIQTCPSCGARVKSRGSWIKGAMLEKAQICVADRVDDQLLLRWVTVEREFTFPRHEKLYTFDPYAYNLFLKTEKGPRAYFYKWHYGPYGSAWWWRDKIGSIGYDSTFIYTENLDKVFGQKYYNVNLKAGLEGKRSVLPFCILLNSLRDCPAAEYLFKLGCPTLAARASGVVDTDAKPGFQSMMGVSKQLLPLYQKYDVTPAEHRIIKNWGGWVSEEEFKAFRSLKISDYHYAEELVTRMSFHRFVTYFAKQVSTHKQKIEYLMMKYRDYLNMSADLGVDLSHKSVRYPSDCVEAHDRVNKRVQLCKAAIDDARFKRNVEAIYEAIGNTDFQRAGFCVVLPQSRTDFVIEGQTLNHCVGSVSTYYENHLKGKRMIFFIRKVSEPDKPFYTMEADMVNKTICQLYGFADCSAPKEVRRFAEAFLKTIGAAPAAKAS